MKLDSLPIKRETHRCKINFYHYLALLELFKEIKYILQKRNQMKI